MKQLDTLWTAFLLSASMGPPQSPQLGANPQGVCSPALGFLVEVGGWGGMSLSLGIRPLDVAWSWLKGPNRLHWAGGLNAVDLGPGFLELECPAYQKPPSQPWGSTDLQPAASTHTSGSEESKPHVLSWNRKTEAKWGTFSRPTLNGQPCCCGLYGKSHFLTLLIPFICAILGFVLTQSTDNFLISGSICKS